ncbi:hypothetical protein [Gynurincola endophyticus]|uniref:hypothetical protein n=1 Tax=Gynurincola endophyticus TaxID=2479004 RepID=UPI000F8D3C91|nr:hypothetical protein [Gynurincola endophyticus]
MNHSPENRNYSCKRSGKISSLLFLVAFVFISYDGFSQQDKYLIEAEKFQFKGEWFEEKDRNSLGGTLLRATGGKKDESTDAFTSVKIWEAGTYAVWMRTPDYEDRPSTRQMQLSVNGVLCERAGKHGKPGFYWEKVAEIPLEKKEVLLRLHNFNFGRCDAILLLKDNKINPNDLALIEIGKWRKNPAVLSVMSENNLNSSIYLPVTTNAKTIASLEKGQIRLKFLQLTDRQNAIVSRTEIKSGNEWVSLPGEQEDHKVFLLNTSLSKVNYQKFYPAWNNSGGNSYFEFDEKKYTVTTDGADLNPFLAGNFSEAIPYNVQQLDNETIQVQYITRNKSLITGFWSLADNGTHLKLRLVCQTAEAGYYSIGVAAFHPFMEHQVSNVLMPPMFQYKRIPENPQMLVSAIMPQPLSIVETNVNDKKWSLFVTADTATFSQDWGSSKYSPIGFSMKNENNLVQPVAFAPVLGMADSKYDAGELIDREFIIGIVNDSWTRALSYISDSVYQVKDYRRQKEESLTETIFNISDLIDNEESGGWDSRLKGFYDIEGNPETAPTVVNATPLANIALPLLAGSESQYLSRALPTIEYTLSRSGYRWAIDVVPTGYNNSRKTLELNPLRSQFTTSYYEGLNRLLNNLNPWLKEIALPGDSLRKAAGYSTAFIPWVQAAAAYRLTGNNKWLKLAEEGAGKYIDAQIYNNSTVPLSHTPFYNASFYAPWWHLTDLYEITKNNKYLKAAEYASHFTISGIRSFPYVKDEQQLIHPGNNFEGNTHIWWKGDKPYRLGFPRKNGDAPEKNIPAWEVSPVGLGFEQPSTYFLTDASKNVRPVFMSSWAPHLLRLYQHSGNKIFEIYARNAVIGRFSNYPGYYATGFTDITLKKDFPYKGPDVSSVYYHHIPPHLAFTLDFLITEAIQRSGGNIEFPYSIQEGFVWFANRIYGGGYGKVFGDEHVKLWMKKGLVTSANPSVNYVTAVSENNFWILLSGESETDEDVEIHWSAETGATSDGTAVIFDANNNKTTIKIVGGKSTLKIPAKGFRAVRIPLKNKNNFTAASPLKKGMYVFDMGAPWGKVFVFRIRSPFGWDSIYGFAETAPIEGAEVKITFNGKAEKITAYPFEWSFYKIKTDEKVELKLELKQGSKIQTKNISISGD